jgi:hypothetical protein
MGRYSAVNTFKFSSKYGIDYFLGYLRGTSGWGFTENGDTSRGTLSPEIEGKHFAMEWKLEKEGGSLFCLEIDGSQLNGRSTQADVVWEKLESLYNRCK